jgi:hypothetical protein
LTRGAKINILHLYVVIVVMLPTQSYKVDDAVLVSFDMMTWLVDALLPNVVDIHLQYKAVL